MPSMADLVWSLPGMYVHSMATDASCPYCQRLTYMEYVQDSARIVDRRDMRAEAAFQCAACGRFSIGGKRHAGFSTDQGAGGFPLLHDRSTPDEISKTLIGSVEYWEPVAPVGKDYEDVPADIAEPAGEAYRCLSIGAFRAAVLMSRAVIEAAAKNKGTTKGKLIEKIDELARLAILRPITAEAAHALRVMGNDMAHGDFATAKITQEDAEDALVLMDEVLNDAFAVESRLGGLLSRRADTEQPTDNASGREPDAQ